LSSIPARSVQVEEFAVSRLVQPGREVRVSCSDLPLGVFIWEPAHVSGIGTLRVTFFNCMDVATESLDIHLTIIS
jgi:hypothetical protein